MKSKNGIYVIVVIIVIFLVGIGYELLQSKDDTSNIGNLSLDFKEIANLKETDVELPNFEIEITGTHIGELNKELFDAYDIKVYEFDAAVDNGWDLVTNHYVGVKFNDVLDLILQDGSYTRLEFFSRTNRSDIFTKESITNNIFLVFSRDGEPIRERNYMTLLAVDYKYKYSVEDVVKINITNDDSYPTYE